MYPSMVPGVYARSPLRAFLKFPLIFNSVLRWLVARRLDSTGFSL